MVSTQSDQNLDAVGPRPVTQATKTALMPGIIAWDGAR